MMLVTLLKPFFSNSKLYSVDFRKSDDMLALKIILLDRYQSDTRALLDVLEKFYIQDKK